MRLLLVDDETRLTAALRKGLTADGFAVDVASDGVEGLERAGQEAYDVLVLDVMLPRMSGYEVVRRLRAAGNWVPVLMLSAKDGEHDQADGLDDGADDYLTKPFSYVVLLARLRALLRRGATARPAVLRVGEVRLDPASHEVDVAGEPVSKVGRAAGRVEGRGGGRRVDAGHVLGTGGGGHRQQARH